MRIVDRLQERLLERAKDHKESDFTIHGQWDLKLLFRPDPTERTFRHRVVLVQTEKQGCCYCPTDQATMDPSLMGLDARHVVPRDPSLHIAVMDAAYSALESPAAREFALTGTAQLKACRRAQLVAEEVCRELSLIGPAGMPSVVVVGVVGHFVSELSQRGCRVFATDLDPEIVGQHIQGVEVAEGRQHTLELVGKCDVALITGMTLSTNTLDEILDVAMREKTRVVMFAETGAWFAQEYCDTMGINAVVSEPFPFYIFEGTSIIRIHRPSGGGHGGGRGDI